MRSQPISGSMIHAVGYHHGCIQWRINHDRAMRDKGSFQAAVVIHLKFDFRRCVFTMLLELPTEIYEEGAGQFYKLQDYYFRIT